MVARRATFRSPGWDHVPETYEDLTKCCDDLLAKGIIPFGCAGKETWCVTEYLEPIIIKTIGFEALNKIFAGEATWNDPDIAGAVNTFQDKAVADLITGSCEESGVADVLEQLL